MMSVRDLCQKNERRLSDLAARAGCFILVAANVLLCFSLVLCAQTPASQPSDANQSWTVTRESHTKDVLPGRIVESHVQNGNRIVDKQSVERVGSDGHFEAYQDIETETVQVDATTVRTITRYFGRDGANAKALVLTTEEEMQSLPGGDSKTVRVTSAPDSDGKLQAGRREISETKKISPDVQETKTTVMLLSITGELVPAMKIENRQQSSGNNTEFKETVQLLDAGSREWKVNEVRQGTITQEGNTRNTEERVSRLDYEGNVSEFSRNTSKESESSSGVKQSIIENYSVDMLGAPRDGRLHLVQRVTSTQSIDSTGKQTTVRNVQEPNPGDPDAGLHVTSFSTETVRSKPSGAEGTRTVKVRNGGGEFEVFAVDTTRSDNVHVIQVQMAPSAKK
jgi:hypothetical protein